MALQTLKNIPLLKLNVLNANDRIYDSIAGDKILEDIANKPSGALIYGELGFPERFDTTLNNVSHTVKNVRVIENLIVGDIDILDTPSGRILNNSVPHYVFRPRCSGTINAEDKVVTIAKFFTFDAIRREADSYSDLI